MPSLLSQTFSIIQDTQRFLQDEVDFIARDHEAYGIRRQANHEQSSPHNGSNLNDHYNGDCDLGAHEIAILSRNNVPYPPAENAETPEQQQLERKAALARLVTGYENQIEGLKSENEHIRREALAIQSKLEAVTSLASQRGHKLMAQKTKYTNEIAAFRQYLQTTSDEHLDGTRYLALKIDDLTTNVSDETKLRDKVEADNKALKARLAEKTESINELKEVVQGQACEIKSFKCTEVKTDALTDKLNDTIEENEVLSAQLKACRDMNQGLLSVIRVKDHKIKTLSDTYEKTRLATPSLAAQFQATYSVLLEKFHLTKEQLDICLNDIAELEQSNRELRNALELSEGGYMADFDVKNELPEVEGKDLDLDFDAVVLEEAACWDRNCKRYPGHVPNEIQSWPTVVL